MYMVWKGKKIDKILLNLEKKRVFRGQIQKLVIGNQEFMDQNKM